MTIEDDPTKKQEYIDEKMLKVSCNEFGELEGDGVCIVVGAEGVGIDVREALSYVLE
jgi:hypothetical protein